MVFVYLEGRLAFTQWVTPKHVTLSRLYTAEEPRFAHLA